MRALDVVRRILGLVTHDVGRKVLALVFALVLFEVLDKQVQSDDTLTVPIKYVNESNLGQTAEDPEEKSVLLIAERGVVGKPLIVADADRPQSVTLQLRASKVALERAKSRRHRFVWRLGKEGPLAPTAEEFEGTEKLIQELGPGARVELAPRLRFTVEAEDTLALSLVPSDVDFTGNLALGYDRNTPNIVFSPREIQLVGPHGLVDTVQHRRSELFEKFNIEGRSASISLPLHVNAEWGRRLRLFDPKGGELSAVNVSVDFQRRMVELSGSEGRFELPVQVLYNDDRLHQLGEGRSSRDGWRLELAKAVNGELRIPLRILIPDTQTTGVGIDRPKIELAKQNVELIVRAHEAIVDRMTLAVHIERFKDFPEDLGVVFAEGASDVQVEVSWKKPESGARPVDDKDKKSGNGDH